MNATFALPFVNDAEAAARRDAIANELAARFRAESALELAVVATLAHSWWCKEQLAKLEVNAVEAQERANLKAEALKAAGEPAAEAEEGEAEAAPGHDPRELRFLDGLNRFARRVERDVVINEKRLAAMVRQREADAGLADLLHELARPEAGEEPVDLPPVTDANGEIDRTAVTLRAEIERRLHEAASNAPFSLDHATPELRAALRALKEKTARLNTELAA